MKTCRKKLHQYDEALKRCPECRDMSNREHYNKNKNLFYTRNKQWRADNPEKVHIIALKSRQKNIPKKENKHKHNKRTIRWRQRNQEKYKQYHKEYGRVYSANRYKTDDVFRARKKISSLLRQHLNSKGYKKNTKTINIIGCSYIDFRNHLISTAFKNYGSYIDLPGIYHIDHIIPISTATSEEEVLALNHYTNLQLLYIEDNLKKSNKLLEFNFLT